MTARLLATGQSGFVGSHLAAWIAARGAQVEWVATPHFDLLDRTALQRVVTAARPDWVIHLAAQSAVPQSFADPRATYDVNFLGTLNLLEALAAQGFRGRLLYVGSGDAYGRVADADLPVQETLPLRPRSPYAVSKAAAEALCFQWSQSGPFEIVLARPFNSLGTDQSTRFAVAEFAQQVAEMAVGRAPPRLVTGDLDVTRDFTDVRDVVRAYVALLERGMSGEPYNVCSGRETTLRSVVLRLAEIAGVPLEVATDPARLRPGEQRRMVGDPAKLAAATGWTASIPLEQTLQDILQDEIRKRQ